MRLNSHSFFSNNSKLLQSQRTENTPLTKGQTFGGSKKLGLSPEHNCVETVKLGDTSLNKKLREVFNLKDESLQERLPGIDAHSPHGGSRLFATNNKKRWEAEPQRETSGQKEITSTNQLAIQRQQCPSMTQIVKASPAEM